MNILHINCNYTNNKLHQLLVQHLNTLAINNNVYVPVCNDIKCAYDDNVIISRCFKKRDRIWFSFKQYKIFKDIKHKVKIETYDIVHAYTLFTDGNCAYNIHKKYNLPYVVAIRNTDVNFFLKYRFWLRKRGIAIMENAEMIFFLSESYKKQVFERYIPNSKRNEIEKKCLVIPNGIDDFWLNNKVKKKRHKENLSIKIMYAGKINKNKNLGLTIKAIDKLINEGYKIQYTVVGEIIDHLVYKEMVKNENITYYSAVEKEKLLEIYRDNDVFVMPSFHESFGLVYVEAMTQGLPIIYTKKEGFDGQFRDGEVGYAVSSHNVEELVDAIKKIINNYDNISSRCVENVDKYRWISIADKYKKEYVKILEESV